MLRPALTLGLVSLVTIFSACDRNAAEPPGPAPAPIQAAPATPGSRATPANPHAGIDLNDPHAGVDMGGQEESPHGGPPAQIDPTRVLEGTIEAGPALAAQIKAGDIIFLSAKKIGPTGQPMSPPIAVKRLDVTALPMQFRLDESNQMMQGTTFDGEVVISARVDRDGEARSREPGDVEGRVKATVPAKGLELVLDTAVE